MEFKRAGHYDLMCMKTRTLGWNGTMEFPESGIEESKGKLII
jgi:hypothetical protein